MVPFDTETLASHLTPDPLVGGLLASWQAFPSFGERGDVAAARVEMDLSPYGSDGVCVGPDCRALVALPLDGTDVAEAAIGDALRSIGIEPRFPELDCRDPRIHAGVCAGGWLADFPDAGNMMVPFLRSEDGSFPTHLGASPQQLERWGYPTERVPSIDADYERCATFAGVEAAMCWARLDQLLTSELVALVPISTSDTVRVFGERVTSLTLDQAFGEPALDRIALTG